MVGPEEGSKASQFGCLLRIPKFREAKYVIAMSQEKIFGGNIHNR